MNLGSSKRKQDLREAGPGLPPSGQMSDEAFELQRPEFARQTGHETDMSGAFAVEAYRFSPVRMFSSVSEIGETRRARAERYTMNSIQYARRQGVLRQINSVLERWPERTGADFLRQMEPLVREFEALVRDIDATVGDKLERARSWRYLGNAYYDLGAGTNPAQLELATDAYKQAELLLVGIENPSEQMKLAYSFGQALFGLSRRSNFWMVEESRHKFLQALEIAEKEMSEAVDPIRSALSAADKVIDLLKIRKEIYRQIADLKRRETHAESDPRQADALAPQETDLFELLIANYHGTSTVCPSGGARHQGVEKLMRCI